MVITKSTFAPLISHTECDSLRVCAPAGEALRAAASNSHVDSVDIHRGSRGDNPTSANVVRDQDIRPLAQEGLIAEPQVPDRIVATIVQHPIARRCEIESRGFLFLSM